MSAAETDLTTIAHLDFEFEHPCEPAGHRDYHSGDEPAAFFVRVTCPGCPRAADMFLCRPGWDWLGERTLQCGQCGHQARSRAEVVTILYVIGGRS